MWNGMEGILKMEIIWFISGVICSTIINGIIFGLYLKKKNKDHKKEIIYAYNKGRHADDWQGVMW